MNVILGTYSGYGSVRTDKGGIHYFAKSLRKYNKDCKVIVLCEKHKVFKELEEICIKYNMQLYTDFSFTYELMLNRYEVYHKILSTWSKESINRILFCDLDDVVFQGDPFSIKLDEQLYCAAEKNMLTDQNSGSSGLNRHWIQQASYVANYDSSNFENQPVVCAGTILGTYSGIMDYLNFYTNAMSNRSNSRDVPDQGLYNIYIYNYTKPEFRKILPYRKSQILTLDSVTFEELNIKDGWIVNDKGAVYNIVHQINRCNPDFMKGMAEFQ